MRRAALILAVALAACQRGKDLDKQYERMCCYNWDHRPACLDWFAKLPKARIDTCAVAREFDRSRPHPPEERLCGISATLDERKATARALGQGLVRAVTGQKCGPTGVHAALETAIAHTAEVCGEDGCLALLGPAEGLASARDLARLARALGPEGLLRAFDKVPLAPEKRAALLDGFWPHKGRALVAAMGDLQPSRDDIADLLGMDPAPLRLLRSRHPGARLLLAARGLETLLPDEAGAVVEGSPCPIVLAVREKLRLEPSHHPKLLQCDPQLAQAPGGPPAGASGPASDGGVPPRAVLCGNTATMEQRRSAARFLERRLEEEIRRGCHTDGLRAALDVALEDLAAACIDEGCLAILKAASYTRTKGDVARMALTMGGERLVHAVARGNFPRWEGPLVAQLFDAHWPGLGRGLVVLLRDEDETTTDLAPMLTGRFWPGMPSSPFAATRADVAPLLAGDPEPLRLLRKVAPLSRLVLAARGLEPLPPQEIDRIVRWSPCPLLLAVREPLKLDARWPSLRPRCEPQHPAPVHPKKAPPAETEPYALPAPVALDPRPEVLDVVPYGPRERLSVQSGFGDNLRERYGFPDASRARCADRIWSCSVPGDPQRTLDACAISVEVCKSDDWAEPPCCTRKCLDGYEALRKAGVPAITAWKQLFQGNDGPCVRGRVGAAAAPAAAPR